MKKTYDGYGITELRRWARDLGIYGRSTMTGEQLVAACKATNRANLNAQIDALLASVAVTAGTLLRHKATGDIIRVTGDIYEWLGVRCVPAEYVECHGWGKDRRAERAAYENEGNARTGHVARHPLWQYEKA